jgi:hypothetical protein
MSINKILLAGMALGFAGDYSFSGGIPDYVRSTKFQYAGLSKHSPSHAQQKRDSKKAKNKRRRIT